MSENIRERVLNLIREMRKNTTDRGCTPGEAAKFAGKVAELIEKYQIDEAELRVKDGATAAPNIEVCQNTLRTGKKVFNPGMTQVVSALSRAMCCKLILLNDSEAVYGVVGDQLDADYVCQIATTVVPSLQMMAHLEGVEHGYERAGLIRWGNQYLTGAAEEIQHRIEKDRKGRSDLKELEAHLTTGGCTALMVVTGESIATHKREVVAEKFKAMYPRTRMSYSKASYDGTARERGREAGKNVGLNVQIS